MSVLYDYQLDAVSHIHNGCILCGGVGSGKSRTALGYYFVQNGGTLEPFTRMKPSPQDLYIITTAKKRDSGEWEGDMAAFCMLLPESLYNHHITIDSWNNITKYVGTRNAFFIFDEQRAIGLGAWGKAFIKIAKQNNWIMLSATPGDNWLDYLPVFLANGFYRTKTEFMDRHVRYDPRVTKFPKIQGYVDVDHLERLRRRLLVDMTFVRKTTQNHIDVVTDYNKAEYRYLIKNRFDPIKNEPFANAAAMCYALRRVVNSDESRRYAVEEIVQAHKRVIIFYNFDYELDILKTLDYGPGCVIAEYNGHRHDTVPEADRWVYLVQYTAGCEGWNCTATDTILFYSQNYSWKVMQQACGRIDRLNTPYEELYYYHIKSKSSIDMAIGRALNTKRVFNERAFTNWSTEL